MGILGRIFFGGLGVALGFVLVTKAEWWLNTFGRIEWAERHGGTRLAYRLIGILFIFLSFVYITGMWNGFLNFILGPLLVHMK